MTRPHWQLFVLISSVFLLLSCAGAPKMLTIADSDQTFPAGAIIDARSGQDIDFETLVNAMASVQVVYVGEQHTRPAHHRIQLQILEAMAGLDLPLAVGMEMFDRTYDPVLARWSGGELTEEAFLQQTHWYANWRYDFGLYRDLLLAVRDRRLPLYGLNLPFHLPAKIAAGGIDSLLFPDRQFIPEVLDFSDNRHRAYLEEVFANHRMPERTRFEFFYQAQVAWEETMAEAVAEHLGDRRMLVIAGNGHIVKKFGIPGRAFRRSQAPFLTVYLATAGDTVDLDAGDYIWVAPSG
jgi:uncharacterized iron-regulated protein